VNLTFVRAFTENELDDADLSIIEFGRRNPQALVISEDADLLMMCHLFRLKGFQLSEFLLFLVNQDLLSKRDAYNSIKQLRAWKNIGKKHFKLLKHHLHKIS